MNTNYIFNEPFLTDGEKLVDFFALSKEDFLNSYSYLTESEYDATFEKVCAFVDARRATR